MRRQLCAVLVERHPTLLEGSKKLVVMAMEQDLWPSSDVYLSAVAMVCDRFKSDPDVCLAALRGRPARHIAWMLPEQGDDRDFVLDLLRRVRVCPRAPHGSYLLCERHGTKIAEHMSERLWHDRCVALALVRCCPHSLRQMPHFSSDEDIVVAAISEADEVIHDAHPDLRANQEFLIRLASEVPMIVCRFPPIFAAKACSLAAARHSRTYPLRCLAHPAFLRDVDVLIEASNNNPKSSAIEIFDDDGKSCWSNPDFVERFCRGTGMRALPKCTWVHEPPSVAVECFERLTSLAMELPRSVRKTDRLVAKAVSTLLKAYSEWAHRAKQTREHRVSASVVVGMLCLDAAGFAPVGEAFAQAVEQTCYALGTLDDDAADDALVTLATEFGEDHPSSSLVAEQVVAARHRPRGADGEFTGAHKRARALFEAGGDAA
jgi:hypothetical protein